MMPETALVTQPGPGPEGSAEQFAVKVGAGLFDRDISGRAKLAGKLVHLGYGSLWGGLFGLIEGSLRLVWVVAGTAYGFALWLIGPALLVPAMRVMLWPKQLGAKRSLLLVAAHLVYGLSLAAAYSLLLSGRVR